MTSSLRSDLITVDTFLQGSSDGGGADLLSLVTSDRTREKGMELDQGEFRLDVRKRFFAETVAGQWSRLPREAVMAPSRSGLKEHLDDAVGGMFWCHVVL